MSSDNGLYTMVDASLPNSGHWLWCEVSPEHNHSSPQTGWVAHISATNRDMQEALAALAIEHKLPTFKFAPPQILEKDQQPDAGSSRGKTAVFYYTEKGIDGETINWDGFIKDASLIVNTLGGAGQSVHGERHVPGSHGIYYSAQTKTAGGRYVPSAMRTSYDLGRTDDPFAHIDLRTEKDRTAPLPKEAERSASKTASGLPGL